MSKTKNKNMQLTRKQIIRLHEICLHFKDVQQFDLSTDHSSGIGVNITVKFSLFENQDTKIDISDYEDW